MATRTRRANDADRPAPRAQSRGTRAAALAYAARGWSVIPVEPRGKHPRVAWLEFQHRIAAPEEIDGWFRKWPDANIGIVTGRISRLAVIDVDAQHDGLRSLAALEAEHGALPRTVEALTGGGGRHLYFDHADPVLHNRVGILPGIDLRGEGGCVVAPPSVHPNGQHYAWASGRAPDEVPIARLPGWFFDSTRATVHAARGLPHWRNLVRQGVAEGERNSTLASLTGHLLWHGIDPEVALELLLAWNQVRCRPPLPDEEVASVVQSIARLHERNLGATDGGRAPER
ncbi:MAG: bifunctional DNA primase/polymerase [Gemmatimonadota bacterium]